MTAAEEWLRARGIQKLQLMVRGDNFKSAPFINPSVTTTRNA